MDLLPQQSKKNVPNWVLNQKKSFFFPVKSRAADTQKLELDIQKVLMDGPTLGNVRISGDLLV